MISNFSSPLHSRRPLPSIYRFHPGLPTSYLPVLSLLSTRQSTPCLPDASYPLLPIQVVYSLHLFSSSTLPRPPPIPTRALSSTLPLPSCPHHSILPLPLPSPPFNRALHSPPAPRHSAPPPSSTPKVNHIQFDSPHHLLRTHSIDRPGASSSKPLQSSVAKTVQPRGP